MKKIKFLAIAAMFCAVGYAGYTAYDRATMTEEEKFMRANLEALTGGEADGHYWQTMARCNTWTMQWACTTVPYADYCSRYVCLVEF